MTSLNLPVPGWMTEDLVLLEEQARRFIAADTFRSSRAGTNAACMTAMFGPRPAQRGSFAGDPGAVWRRRRELLHMRSVISRELSLAGFDSFGAPLHSGIVAPYILHYGTEEQKRRWLPGLVSGELVGAIAMSEPGTGSDLQGVRTTARKSGNGYVLNGSKTFITNGQHANLIVVVAKTEASAGAKGVSLMVVETDGSPGFRRGRKLKKLGMDAADTSELFFDDVQLPPENLLGRRRRSGLRATDERPSSRAAHRRRACASHDGAGACALRSNTSSSVRRSARRSSSFRTRSSCWPNASPRRRSCPGFS